MYKIDKEYPSPVPNTATNHAATANSSLLIVVFLVTLTLSLTLVVKLSHQLIVEIRNLRPILSMALLPNHFFELGHTVWLYS